MPEKKKVMVGMSGGVDSSVAALILMRENYEVSGVTLRLHDSEPTETEYRTCCSLNDVLDARNVCDRLGIRHYVFNFIERFDHDVIERFIQQYNNGLTPNPCIDCNKFIKFKEMLERAFLLEQDYIATGHYAIRSYDNGSERYLLSRPVDRHKDQTYVLYGLTQEQLKHTLFPLGSLTKPQVREIAEENGFVNANKPDSQDICFVPDGKYAEFIEKHTTKKSLPGDFVSVSGEKLGQHNGIIRYTIGQRKGLGIAFGKPQFVVDKNTANNTVVLGDEKYLFKNTATAVDCNFIAIEKLDSLMNVSVKVRYSQTEQAATIRPDDNGNVVIEFKEPQRAITPGQAAVFYSGDTVIGGGTII